MGRKRNRFRICFLTFPMPPTHSDCPRFFLFLKIARQNLILVGSWRVFYWLSPGILPEAAAPPIMLTGKSINAVPGDDGVFFSARFPIPHRAMHPSAYGPPAYGRKSFPEPYAQIHKGWLGLPSRQNLSANLDRAACHSDPPLKWVFKKNSL